MTVSDGLLDQLSRVILAKRRLKNVSEDISLAVGEFVIRTEEDQRDQIAVITVLSQWEARLQEKEDRIRAEIKGEARDEYAET